MTLTLLRVYPACSSLATACSMTLSHTSLYFICVVLVPPDYN
jgi:hypothetical protein